MKKRWSHIQTLTFLIFITRKCISTACPTISPNERPCNLSKTFFIFMLVIFDFYPHNIRKKCHKCCYPQSKTGQKDSSSSKQQVMTIMFKNSPIAFPKKKVKIKPDISFTLTNILPAQKLPSQTAWYQSNIIKVSISNKVSEHSQKVASLLRINIGFENMRMEEVRKAEKSIK